MRIRQTFFINLFLFLLVWGFFTYRHRERSDFRDLSTYSKQQFLNEERYTVENSKINRIEQIDRQIEELENLKRGFLSKANRLDDQAERLQFYDRSFLESRRMSELAQENRDKAQRTQDEIDRLKLERAKLVQSGKGP